MIDQVYVMFGEPVVVHFAVRVVLPVASIVVAVLLMEMPVSTFESASTTQPARNDPKKKEISLANNFMIASRANLQV